MDKFCFFSSSVRILFAWQKCKVTAHQFLSMQTSACCSLLSLVFLNQCFRWDDWFDSFLARKSMSNTADKKWKKKMKSSKETRYFFSHSFVYSDRQINKVRQQTFASTWNCCRFHSVFIVVFCIMVGKEENNNPKMSHLVLFTQSLDVMTVSILSIKVSPFT